MSTTLGYIGGWRWPLLAMLGAGAMLGAAHGFERFAYLDPCPLCLRQREIYWAILAMAGVGLLLWRIRDTRRFLEGLNILIGLVFLCGAGIAFYHMGVEYGWFPPPPGCATQSAQDAAASAMSGNLRLDERIATASCTKVPWSFLGLSMAAWNMGLSLVFAAASLVAARQTAMAS